MSRALEKMAKLYANEECTGNAMYGEGLHEGYLAGYKTAAPQWISVKDRLPENMQTVIYRLSVPTVKGPTWKIDYGEWDANEQSFFGEFFDYRDLQWDVTHWMPLPELPKEEE